MENSCNYVVRALPKWGEGMGKKKSNITFGRNLDSAIYN